MIVNLLLQLFLVVYYTIIYKKHYEKIYDSRFKIMGAWPTMIYHLLPMKISWHVNDFTVTIMTVGGVLTCFTPEILRKHIYKEENIKVKWYTYAEFLSLVFLFFFCIIRDLLE